MTIEPMEGRARQAAAPVLGTPADALGVELLAGHASARRYLRVHARSRSVVVMVLPDDALASEEATAGEAPEELPFLSVQRYLAGLGVRVPEVFAVDLAEGTVVLEDLGDRTLEAALLAAPDAAAARAELYGRAVDDLAFLRQEACASRTRRPCPSPGASTTTCSAGSSTTSGSGASRRGRAPSCPPPSARWSTAPSTRSPAASPSSPRA